MPKLKFFVPNGATALSLLLGLASVVMAVEGRFELAAWMILWATLLDKLDGSLARLLGASSQFGMEFDSFADFVSFGIAPAALVYFYGQSVGVDSQLLVPATAAYALALAIRLARFNVSDPPFGDRLFYGIPGTLCGAIVAAGFITWRRHGSPSGWLEAAPTVLFLFAIMMLSQLRLPKLKPRKNPVFNAFQALNVVAAYLCGAMMWAPEFLLGLALTFLFVGVAWCLLHPPKAGDSLPAPPLEAESDVEEPLVA